MDYDPLPQRVRKKKQRDAHRENRVDKPADCVRDQGEGAAVKPVGANPNPPMLGFTADTWSFKYLDHSADVQIYSWGKDIETALANQALGMFNYMTPLEEIYASIGRNSEQYETKEMSMAGHDMLSLTYHFLDELLFAFSTELYVVCGIQILELDLQEWSVSVKTWGCKFDERKHSKGTEIKAITYSAMEVIQPGEADINGNKVDHAEIFVIVDI